MLKKECCNERNVINNIAFIFQLIKPTTLFQRKETKMDPQQG